MRPGKNIFLLENMNGCLFYADVHLIRWARIKSSNRNFVYYFVPMAPENGVLPVKNILPPLQMSVALIYMSILPRSFWFIWICCMINGCAAWDNSFIRTEPLQPYVTCKTFGFIWKRLKTYVQIQRRSSLFAAHLEMNFVWSSSRFFFCKPKSSANSICNSE